MTTISFARRSSTLVLSIAPILLVAACAADKPPAASAPTSMAVEAPPPPSARTEPTAGTIAVMDDVRRACGIPDEDAFFAFDSATIASSDIRRSTWSRAASAPAHWPGARCA